MLTSLIGTPWMPSIDGGILFVEDINEQPYRIERMLLQLQQTGVLDRQRAVLCGDFSGFRVADYDNGYDLDAAFDYVRHITATPIVTGLPFGHEPKKLTLAVGAVADVKVAGGRCTLTQRWKLG
jgi:muramoyltetrapeptide carboxypeptidase